MPDDLIRLYAQYSGLSEEEVQKGVNGFTAFNQLEWEVTPGRSWEEKAKTFYRSAHGYVFDLIHGSRSKAHLKRVYEHFGHWDYLLDSGPDVLEFGGGLGLTCALLRDLEAFESRKT